jgi:type II secretory pathway pseudopilin PulG
MIEVIVAVMIVAILAAVGYPLLKGNRSEIKTRAAARQLESLAQRARLLAINQQVPVRLVLNCAKPGGVESCYADLQSAVYTDAEVSGWVKRPEERQVLDPKVQVVKANEDADSDGATSFPNIYWAIFMPTNLVLSDPRGFELFVYNGDKIGADKEGWLFTVNNISGHATINRDVMAIDG